MNAGKGAFCIHLGSCQLPAGPQRGEEPAAAEPRRGLADRTPGGKEGGLGGWSSAASSILSSPRLGRVRGEAALRGAAMAARPLERAREAARPLSAARAAARPARAGPAQPVAGGEGAGRRAGAANQRPRRRRGGKFKRAGRGAPPGLGSPQGGFNAAVSSLRTVSPTVAKPP